MAMSHFSSPPKRYKTLWQCSFYNMLQQLTHEVKANLGALGCLTQWTRTPSRKGNQRLNSTETHIYSKHDATEKSKIQQLVLFVVSVLKWTKCGDQIGANCCLVRNTFKENEFFLNIRDIIWCFLFQEALNASQCRFNLSHVEKKILANGVLIALIILRKVAYIYINTRYHVN